MINIAIVDDDKTYVECVKEYLKRYEKETGKAISVSTFSDGDAIVRQYDFQFDIIFMDVEMKFMDGMSAAEEIRKKDSQVVIIFITNMAQYAIRGYAVQALDYLLKPVSYYAFSQCLNKALSRKEKRETKTVVLDIKGGSARFDIKDIYYIETQGHTTTCHVVNGEYQLLSTMRGVEEILSKMYFFRISKWYLINLQHVDNFCDDCVTLGKYKFTVSRTKRKDFLKALTAYWEEVVR